MGDDLEKVCGYVICKNDVLIINIGWYKQYEDGDYFVYCFGLVLFVVDWMVEKGIKVVGYDIQVNDYLFVMVIGLQCNGLILLYLEVEYKEWFGGCGWEEDFLEWELVYNKLFSNGIFGIENVGGDLDVVIGKCCIFVFFFWNWDCGDGCIICLVVMIDKGQQYCIEMGESF